MESENDELIKLLLAVGANPNQWIQQDPKLRDQSGGDQGKPLLCIFFNDITMVRFLLDAGASPDRIYPYLHIKEGRTFVGGSPLSEAALRRNASLIELLLSKVAGERKEEVLADCLAIVINMKSIEAVKLASSCWG